MFFAALTLPVGKTLSSTLAVLSAVSLAATRGQRLSERIRKDPLVWALSLLLGIFMAGLLHSEDLHEGVKMVRKVLLLMGFYLLCSLHLRGWHDGRRVLLGFVIGMVAVNCLAILRFFGLGGHAFVTPCSARMHHIWFGNLSATAFYTSVIMALESERKPLLWIAALLTCSGVLLSASRGAWLAMASVLLLMVPILVMRYRRWLAVLFLIASVGGVALAGRDLIVSRVEKALAEVSAFTSGEHNPSSVGDRLCMWYVCMRILRAHPWLGVGTGDYLVEARRLVQHDPTLQHILHYNQPHNIYLHSLVMHGVIGFAGFMAVFAFMIFRAIRTLWSPLWSPGTIALAALVHFLVAGLTEGVIRVHVMMASLGIFLGATLSPPIMYNGGNGPQRANKTKGQG